MDNEEIFDRGCFSMGWTEVQSSMTPKQKKDLATLLLELQDIKKDFEKTRKTKKLSLKTGLNLQSCFLLCESNFIYSRLSNANLHS